jgi:hypothetical protein
VEKLRFWQNTMWEASQSGPSIREFCRQRKLKEGQFYWWQRRLSVARQAEKGRSQRGAVPATFALVSDAPGVRDARIELVLAGGRRL